MGGQERVGEYEEIERERVNNDSFIHLTQCGLSLSLSLSLSREQQELPVCVNVCMCTCKSENEPPRKQDDRIDREER